MTREQLEKLVGGKALTGLEGKIRAFGKMLQEGTVVGKGEKCQVCEWFHAHWSKAWRNSRVWEDTSHLFEVE